MMMLLRRLSSPSSRQIIRAFPWPARDERGWRPISAALDGRRCGSSSSTAVNNLVKRKVALVAGYLGTGYHGVQLNKDVDTIENELRKAILTAGAMRESNFEDLAKIDWSRSSRTDKGVHAGCIVFSGKLLIDEENSVDPATGRIESLAKAINAALPPTIRVFSCTRVNKRFSARKNCVLREYEYFLPLSFLKSSLSGSINDDNDINHAVDTFCAALRKYEGIHDFHNFTKSRSFFYRQHAKNRRHKEESQVACSEDDDQQGIHFVERDDGSYMTAEYADDASQFADRSEASRKQLPRHRRAIYSCSGSLIHAFFGEPYIRVHIVGQAFLLHQIRCMIGGALAVASKGMSETLFEAALETNRIIRIPIAPAEGLILLSSSFGGKLHSVSLYEDFNTKLASENKDVSHRVLLDKIEDRAMQAFREDIIYREVHRAWQTVSEIGRWKAYLDRTNEANADIDEDEVTNLLREAKTAVNVKRERQTTFVQHNRSAKIEESKPRGVLPRQFTTKLCVRFTIPPGIFTADLRRGLARHLKLGKLPAGSSEEELFQYVDNVGVERLAEEGRRIRLQLSLDDDSFVTEVTI